jgi:hypothetical protein
MVPQIQHQQEEVENRRRGSLGSHNIPNEERKEPIQSPRLEERFQDADDNYNDRQAQDINMRQEVEQLNELDNHPHQIAAPQINDRDIGLAVENQVVEQNDDR